jgi:hypothetical protein
MGIGWMLIQYMPGYVGTLKWRRSSEGLAGERQQKKAPSKEVSPAQEA